jgi:putative (di)nucleoside polyphosphate hydrolase
MDNRDVIDAHGFRANVGIMLVRADGMLFLGRRARGGGWQFPQGGIRTGETAEQALYRELHEEVGLTPGDVDLVAQTRRWMRYRLPSRFIRRDRQPLCIGQKQRWFLLRLKHDQGCFELAGSDEPEFDEWRWVDWWEPVREVIQFKRRVYARALAELAPAAFPEGAPAYPSWWGAAPRAYAAAHGGECRAPGQPGARNVEGRRCE